MSEKKGRVSLSIPADEYLRVYQGAAKKGHARDLQGKSISFPVNILQSFVSHDGVQGTFTIFFDASHRFTKIVRD